MFRLCYCSSYINRSVRRDDTQYLLRNLYRQIRQFKSLSSPNLTKIQIRKPSNLVTRWLFLSSTGLGLGLASIKAHGNNVVFCEGANRLVGIIPIENESLSNFDWHTFWKYLKPHLLTFIAAVIAALAVAYFNIRIPQLLGDVTNIVASFSKRIVPGGLGDAALSAGSKDIIKEGFSKAMRQPAVSLFSMYLAQSAFTFLYIFLLSGIGERMAAEIRKDLFASIVRQDIQFFDKYRTGELVNRLTTDVQDLKSSFKQCVSQGLRSGAQLIGGTISLFLISPPLTGIAVLCIPTVVILGSVIGSMLRGMSRRAQAQMERSTAVGDEAIGNIRTVRAFAMEDVECKLFGKETDRARDLNENLGIGIALFQAGTNMFLNGLVLATLYMGGTLLASDRLSAGDLMAFLVASQAVQRSLTQGSLLLGHVVRGLSAGARVFEFVNLHPIIPLVGGITIPEFALQGAVSFNNVSFSYPSRPDAKVLKSVTLHIPPGKTVAIVGASGSGKSTVATLLERFYEPTDGYISLDGTPITKMCPRWLRGSVLGFIDQNPTLFATTVMENIRYGKPSATDEEVIEAAKHANAHSFITEFPNGYNTVVGERGLALSGGQRQRVSIARALLKNPKVLILDEATSALDTQSEAVVQEALDDASKGRTVLVIAHRLSTIKNADIIIVMRNGTIVEVGTHKSLKERMGLYWSLIKQQNLEELTEKPDDLVKDVPLLIEE